MSSSSSTPSPANLYDDKSLSVIRSAVASMVLCLVFYSARILSRVVARTRIIASDYVLFGGVIACYVISCVDLWGRILSYLEKALAKVFPVIRLGLGKHIQVVAMTNPSLSNVVTMLKVRMARFPSIMAKLIISSVSHGQQLFLCLWSSYRENLSSPTLPSSLHEQKTPFLDQCCSNICCGLGNRFHRRLNLFLQTYSCLLGLSNSTLPLLHQQPKILCRHGCSKYPGGYSHSVHACKASLEAESRPTVKTGLDFHLLIGWLVRIPEPWYRAERLLTMHSVCVASIIRVFTLFQIDNKDPTCEFMRKAP